jgi:hypothetical protein
VRKHGTRLALAAICLSTACACGTSAPPTKTTAARITARTMGGEAPGGLTPTGGGGAAAGALAGDGPVQRARATPVDPDERPRVAARLDPCTLVRNAELEAVLHANVVSATLAPLGPTCVYEVAGSRSELTLAVQPGRLSAVAHSLKRTRPVSVARHRAYCGVLGKEQLVVAVSAGRILDVAAPCPVAVAVARKALIRLASAA